MDNNYADKSGEANKGAAGKSLEMIKAGGQSGQGSGPTGSSRSYPKGGKPKMSPDFNPQKVKACDFAVGGV